MQTTNTPIPLSNASQEAVILYHGSCANLMYNQWNMRQEMREIDLLYQREKDWTLENVRARTANRYGDSDKYQNITVPVVMPQVEAAVAYQSSVFLTGEPIFGAVSSPEYEDEAMQMETIISENSIRGGWVQQLMMAFRDGFKYNLGGCEIKWDAYKLAAFETDLNFAGGTQGKPKEEIWSGNCLKRLDMYNTFFDPRVAPTEMHKRGEFIGYTELIGRIELKTIINNLPDKRVENVVKAFESSYGGLAGTTAGASGILNYYLPPINPDALIQKNMFGQFSWDAWAGLAKPNSNSNQRDINYRNLYELTTLYARILPSDFNIRVPNANTPQIWKFIIVNHQVVIYAERQTNAHNYLPCLLMQPLEDGLQYQTKSLAKNIAPIQSVSSALLNSVIAARRRAISDRVLFDPSRITKEAINSDNPSAKIPVRPAAYGKNISDSVYAFPFKDDQSQIAFSEIGTLSNMADAISGRNKAQQGQFVKGNKTKEEYNSVMQNANGRDQMVSMLLESQFFTPLKEIIKINILQYQQATTYYNTPKNTNVKIDPTALRKAILAFKISDGLVPSDKLIGADESMVAMQQIGGSTQLAAGYNVAPLFSYLMKIRGAKISEFEKSPEQQAYESAMMQWQQAFAQVTEQLKIVMPAVKEQPLPEILKLIKEMQASLKQPVPQDFGYNPNPQAKPTTTQPTTGTQQ